jgi:hypothetical protein
MRNYLEKLLMMLKEMINLDKLRISLKYDFKNLFLLEYMTFRKAAINLITN